MAFSQTVFSVVVFFLFSFFFCISVDCHRAFLAGSQICHEIQKLPPSSSVLCVYIHVHACMCTTHTLTRTRTHTHTHTHTISFHVSFFTLLLCHLFQNLSVHFCFPFLSQTPTLRCVIILLGSRPSSAADSCTHPSFPSTLSEQSHMSFFSSFFYCYPL